VGPLGFSRKKRLLAQAKCLIIPSLVAETSSLVAMESLACGTPVIALRSGALPEIVEHGRTGFVVSDVRGIARALLKVERLDPDDCRTAAQVRFSAHSMAEKYLGVYEQLIRKSPRN
jgi:glycosyltransferase involved in cell wall biosynthesis